MQFFALISPRKLDLRVFSLLVGLAAYLIFIGTRSIRLARESERGRAEVPLANTLRTLGTRCNARIGKFRDQLARPSPTRTAVLVVLGLLFGGRSYRERFVFAIIFMGLAGGLTIPDRKV